MQEHPKTSSLLRKLLTGDDNKLAAKIPAATVLITLNLNI